ncbi:hypothetical protein [Microbacterium album]|nr:hypothetical protein [Microbacterium album]
MTRIVRTLPALALVLLAGCTSQPAVKDASFINVDTPGVLGFENGDCFLDLEENRALGEEMLTTTECVGASNQVYTFVELSDGPWDEERVAEEATALCEEGFDELWGKPGESDLAFYPAPPSERSWAEGDRDAMCVVYSLEGRFTVDPLERA